MNSSAAETLVKPFLRGRFHQEAFFFALGACLMLIFKATSARSTLAAVIYSLSITNLLGTSALYHRLHWNEMRRRWMKRLDHSGIFISIAGTATPVCLLALPPESGHRLLLIFWAAAALGVFISMFWVTAPKWVSVVLYVGMGWLAAPYLSELSQSLGTSSLLLLLIGGVIYTIGAIVYALKKPNPYPRVFGYHEVFHLLVVIAAALQFLMIYKLII